MEAIGFGACGNVAARRRIKPPNLPADRLEPGIFRRLFVNQLVDLRADFTQLYIPTN